MQTRNRFRPLCLLLLLAAASACCPCRKYQKLYGAPLVGTRWLLIQLDGEEVANSDGRFSLRFEDAKRLSGRGGCNRYSASCDTEAGGHLRVGAVCLGCSSSSQRFGGMRGASGPSGKQRGRGGAGRMRQGVL